jgi:hypothetical protein
VNVWLEMVPVASAFSGPFSTHLKLTPPTRLVPRLTSPVPFYKFKRGIYCVAKKYRESAASRRSLVWGFWGRLLAARSLTPRLGILRRSAGIQYIAGLQLGQSQGGRWDRSGLLMFASTVIRQCLRSHSGM